ncbi:MAG TPA: AAA family ATPase [Polyangiaceae bacterium]|nr:AAA family ATPase [Polyangiaceae bacterium]
MYLRSIHIENFRCLRDVDLEFEPLTVLVGPNGAGKSSVLDVLQPQVSFAPRDAWRQDRAVSFKRTGILHDATPFQHECSVGGSTPTATWNFQRLQLSPRALRSEQTLQEQLVLASDGSNLNNVLSTLPRTVRNEIAARLEELVPLYSDVDLKPTDGGRQRLVFRDRWAEGIWHDAQEVSDGTMVAVAFLALTHLAYPPDILAIEDPEHSLHPFLLGELIALLRRLTAGELGRKAVQVILTTHSAELLDFVDPREVRFLSREMTDGSTVVRRAPIESEQWKAAYETYERSLGEIWLSGGLGGVPNVPTHH